MFLNETLVLLTYTANMMATLPNETNTQNISKINVIGNDNSDLKNNYSTTTLSPEEEENKFNLEDDWYMWRCYQPYGCFYIGAPWSGENRPVSTFPGRPESVDPHYMLYTREQSNDPYELMIDRLDIIRQSPLKNHTTLYFIVHGYLDNGDKTWILRTKRELLIREDCNVVVVNWIVGAGPPYPQAVANTRLVGAMTARLAMQLIQEAGVSEHRIHAIGHSLGAHTCGYIGYYLRTQYGYKLGRITGLDPAEPHFSNTSPMVRLDPTDAEFVTAIHTDSSPFVTGGLGITQPVGHIDFYPNGGRNQPGCNNGVLNSITLERGSFFRGIKRFLGCNHIRSYDYFIESINTKCPFIAVPCSSWKNFQEGKCFDCINQYCPRFGFDAQPGNYHASVYLMTAAEKPFCRGHYRVTINISKTAESVDHGGEVGTFVIRVIGAANNDSNNNYDHDNDHASDLKISERIELSEASTYYEPGSSHTVVLPGEIVGTPQAVEITWEYRTSVFNPLTWRLLHKPKAYIDSLQIDSLEAGKGITVCPDESKTITANEPKILTVENCHYHDTSESNAITHQTVN
ncbi:pancreatic lipase-related protein 2-like [Microplitis mediator]|uniref:pancreatic lipase-related protein 2-like n=1 Tax=Microplitis mediator TaxID=375433 RepID=UPI002553B7A3|nr:pancreatic lipase-related protein 2-like [Microplitis mediator]